MSFEMLWRNSYWDYPLTGVGLYTFNDIVEYVYFDVVEYGHIAYTINEDEIPDYADHDLTVDGRYQYYKNPLYGVYRIDEDEMKELIRSHYEFQQFMGYHTDHDPYVYYPYREMGEQFKQNEKGITVTKKKLMGTFYSHDIKNFSRQGSVLSSMEKLN